MKLKEALALQNDRRGSTPLHVHWLVCGFQPLHLSTFLSGHLLSRLSGDVDLKVGVYGDLLGNLEAAQNSEAVAAAVVVEWSDLDPRLGLRSSGGWTTEKKLEALAGARNRCEQILTGLRELGARMPVALVSPSLPLPPIGGTPYGQRSEVELQLNGILADFLQRAGGLPGVRVVEAPPSRAGESTLDPAMELMTGFPYGVAFADALAERIAAALWPSSPKKGLITDLDDTLWRGIVGEIGPDAVSWGQDSHAQTHGLYQQMLGHLASSGVLVAVCSKNDPKPVEAALARPDLFVSPDSFFPIHASWAPKSEGVRGILETWNVAADSVVFVDDSRMELEEVARAHPGITGLHFQADDPAAVWDLLGKLRVLFGKSTRSEEDLIRQASIRASAKMRESEGGASDSPEFLEGLEGSVTLSWRVAPDDSRPLELVNKTNQFNLNGRRIGEGDWKRELAEPDALVAVVSYTDKFGPLGKIAVLKGRRRANAVHVSHWVMSCRAFSRRLEHHMLDVLFQHGGVEEITFDYEETDRNGPLQDFFRATGIVADASGTARLSRSDFLAQNVVLPHRVIGGQAGDGGPRP